MAQPRVRIAASPARLVHGLQEAASRRQRQCAQSIGVVQRRSMNAGRSGLGIRRCDSSLCHRIMVYQRATKCKAGSARYSGQSCEQAGSKVPHGGHGDSSHQGPLRNNNVALRAKRLEPLHQAPKIPTRAPVMGGLDPPIAHSQQYANDVIPVSNRPMTMAGTCRPMTLSDRCARYVNR